MWPFNGVTAETTLSSVSSDCVTWIYYNVSVVLILLDLSVNFLYVDIR